jgi:uncharacterized protein YbjT (DUF2867 family)
MFRFAKAIGARRYSRPVRVLITGGGGFLGSHLVERVRGEGLEPYVARKRDYDLTSATDMARLFAAAEPELVVHLAAEVGGIGANRDNPSRRTSFRQGLERTVSWYRSHLVAETAAE